MFEFKGGVVLYFNRFNNYARNLRVVTIFFSMDLIVLEVIIAKINKLDGQTNIGCTFNLHKHIVFFSKSKQKLDVNM